MTVRGSFKDNSRSALARAAIAIPFALAVCAGAPSARAGGNGAPDPGFETAPTVPTNLVGTPGVKLLDPNAMYSGSLKGGGKIECEGDASWGSVSDPSHSTTWVRSMYDSQKIAIEVDLPNAIVRVGIQANGAEKDIILPPNTTLSPDLKKMLAVTGTYAVALCNRVLQGYMYGGDKEAPFKPSGVTVSGNKVAPQFLSLVANSL